MSDQSTPVNVDELKEGLYYDKSIDFSNQVQMLFAEDGIVLEFRALIPSLVGKGGEMHIKINPEKIAPSYRVFLPYNAALNFSKGLHAGMSDLIEKGVLKEAGKDA